LSHSVNAISADTLILLLACNTTRFIEGSIIHHHFFDDHGDYKLCTRL
jgi:hypothetical protein